MPGGDFEKLAGQLAATGAAAAAATKAAVVESTKVTAAAALAAQGRAGASSGRLRGVGKSGAPIGIAGQVTGLTGVVRALGPAWLLDHDTKPHRGHPGTKGKLYFEEAVEASEPVIEAIFVAHETAAVVRGLI